MISQLNATTASRDKSGSIHRRPETKLKQYPKNDQQITSGVFKPFKNKNGTITTRSKKDVSKQHHTQTQKTVEARPPASKTRNKNNKKLEYLSILNKPQQPETPPQDFNELAADMLDRLVQLEKCLKKQSGTQEAYELTKRYRTNFATLVKSSVRALTQMQQQREAEAIHGVENISNLQGDILEKQGIMASIQSQRDTLRKKVQRQERMIQSYKASIRHMKEKEARVARLMYALRKHGVDIDSVYQDEIATPFEETPSDSEEDQQEEEHYAHHEGVGRQMQQSEYQPHVIARNHSY